MRSTFFFVTPILLTMAILCAECNAFAPPPPSMLRKSKKIARTALHMPDLENPSGPFDGATSRVVPRGGASTAMAKLTSVANFAGMLCVIDCTVLPVLTVATPVLSAFKIPMLSESLLHSMSHAISLFFVLPVGSLSSSLNYLQSKAKAPFLVSLLGLLLIGSANFDWCHFGIHNAVAHALHCGTWVHRSVNLLGCAFLIGGNRVAHKKAHEAGACCDHKH
ncbi:hypothetical protein TrST_g444 [Triparma strigata]|uniref:MerC domain-containing protein n=1 Tax=Triparma strigata TaxID=1606541 RepID=A0A9W7B7E8_9STRA|nr:hypothetical protein TrST_g444 [Triparma strigata]